MRWIRSWPATIPPGRAHVVDGLDRLVIDNYDYAPLAGLDDDVLLLEWDMALSREDAERFERYARAHPAEVCVARYRLYHVAPEPVWAHRWVSPRDGSEEWVDSTARSCDYFSFGLVYLPRAAVREFLAAPAPDRGRPPFLPDDAPYADCRMHDQTFSVWHRHRYSRAGPVVIVANVAPVHLHY